MKNLNPIVIGTLGRITIKHIFTIAKLFGYIKYRLANYLTRNIMKLLGKGTGSSMRFKFPKNNRKISDFLFVCSLHCVIP